MNPRSLLVAAALTFGSSALADDARDQEIFGAPTTTGEKALTPDNEMTKRLLDSLQVGGRLEVRGDLGQHEGIPVGGADFGELKQADVYFDTRPTKELRGFLRLRFTEGSGADGQQAALDGTVDAPVRCSAGCLRNDIDEMWFKWGMGERVYATFGKQHVKWGSGHFWNPTDFTQTKVIDPLALFDRRLGTEMLKLHLPFEKQGYNLYALLEYGGAQHVDQISGALRGEFAFGGVGEAAISAQTAAHAPIRLGFDVSSGVGVFDVHSETAWTKRAGQQLYRGNLDPDSGQLPSSYLNSDKWFVQTVAGIDRSFKYNADNSITIGAEYFYNQLGYDDRDLEIYSLLNGQSQSLYGGRHYVGGYINLPYPGSWTETQFFLSGLRNLSDQTSLVRLTGSWLLYKNAEIQGFLGRCVGDYGELCFRVPSTYKTLAANPNLSSQLQEAVASLPTTRTLTTAGLAIVLKF